MNEDLNKWFREKWVRMNTKGDIVGDCARDEGEGKPKCLPLAKARAMDKKDRASAAIRKRREDPVADRAGKGNKPINVATEEVSTSELIKNSHSKRGAPGTLKAKIKGPLTLEKIRSLKNRANATTLDKKQANFYINMHSEEYLEEKNTPTNPGLWARAKSLARSKFDVYPSAYANGWAAKWYKGKGGGWKSVQEGTKMKTLKEILAEGVAVSSDFKLVNSVNAQGKPITRKVRAHRKTINPVTKDPSEEKLDVLTSIQKFVGRQYAEGVNDPDYRGNHNNEFDELEDLASKSALTGSELNRHRVLTKKYGINSPKDMAKLPAMKKNAEAGYKERQDEINAETEKRNQQHMQDKLTDMEYAADPEGFMKRRTQKEEASSAARQAAIAINMKKLGKKPKHMGEEKGSVESGEWKKIPIGVIDGPGGYEEGQKRIKDYESGKIDKNGKPIPPVVDRSRQAPKEKQTSNEEVESIDEISTDGYHKAAVKSRMDAAVKVASSMGSDKEAKTKLDARNKGLKRLSDRTSADMKKANSGPQKPTVSTHDGNDRGYGKGRYMGDSYELLGQVVEGQSPSMRMFKALQKIKQQREQDEARKKENEKRALNPVKEQYAGSGQSKDMQRAVDAAHRDAERKMMRDMHGNSYQDKPIPEHDNSTVDISSDGKGGYSASVTKTPKSKPQAAATNEAKK